VRLPSGPGYADQVEKEHRWLPGFASQLPLPVPVPLAMGVPGCGYPWPWSIYRWLSGEPAATARPADRAAFAADVGPGPRVGAVESHDRPRRCAAG
jgi:aminoglycoside phosphotransferase (APT) family kinase protein